MNWVVVPMIPWCEQEAIFEKRVGRAYWHTIIFLLRHKTQVIEAARDRWWHGYHIFGDSIFDFTDEELTTEKTEEAADLLNYQIVQDERRANG